MLRSLPGSPVQGLCWAWLGVIRVLTSLHLALHSPDVSNAIQHDQNEINRELDGSFWLCKLRGNGFCQGLLIWHFLLYVCFSFIQYEVQGAMLKPHFNWWSTFSSPDWGLLLQLYKWPAPGLGKAWAAPLLFFPQPSPTSAFMDYGCPDHGQLNGPLLSGPPYRLQPPILGATSPKAPPWLLITSLLRKLQ